MYYMYEYKFNLTCEDKLTLSKNSFKNKYKLKTKQIFAIDKIKKDFTTADTANERCRDQDSNLGYFGHNEGY